MRSAVQKRQSVSTAWGDVSMAFERRLAFSHQSRKLSGDIDLVFAQYGLRVLRRQFIDDVVCAWSSVSSVASMLDSTSEICSLQFAANATKEERKAVYVLSCSSIPPHHAKKPNKSCYTNSIIHIRHADRFYRREEQNNTDKANPRHCNRVDGFTPSSHGEGSRVEFDSAFVPAVSDDDGDVTDVERGGCDVEDGDYSQRTPDADEIETTAKNDHEPDGVDGGVGH